MQLLEQKLLSVALPLLCVRFVLAPMEREEEGGGRAGDQTGIIPWYSARENGQVVTSLQTRLQSKSNCRFTIKSSAAEKLRAVLFGCCFLQVLISSKVTITFQC